MNLLAVISNMTPGQKYTAAQLSVICAASHQNISSTMRAAAGGAVQRHKKDGDSIFTYSTNQFSLDLEGTKTVTFNNCEKETAATNSADIKQHEFAHITDLVSLNDDDLKLFCAELPGLVETLRLSAAIADLAKQPLADSVPVIYWKSDGEDTSTVIFKTPQVAEAVSKSRTSKLVSLPIKEYSDV